MAAHYKSPGASVNAEVSTGAFREIFLTDLLSKFLPQNNQFGPAKRFH